MAAMYHAYALYSNYDDYLRQTEEKCQTNSIKHQQTCWSGLSHLWSNVAETVPCVVFDCDTCGQEFTEPCMKHSKRIKTDDQMFTSDCQVLDKGTRQSCVEDTGSCMETAGPNISRRRSNNDCHTLQADGITASSRPIRHRQVPNAAFLSRTTGQCRKTPQTDDKTLGHDNMLVESESNGYLQQQNHSDHRPFENEGQMETYSGELLTHKTTLEYKVASKSDSHSHVRQLFKCPVDVESNASSKVDTEFRKVSPQANSTEESSNEDRFLRDPVIIDLSDIDPFSDENIGTKNHPIMVGNDVASDIIEYNGNSMKENHMVDNIVDDIQLRKSPTDHTEDSVSATSFASTGTLTTPIAENQDQSMYVIAVGGAGTREIDDIEENISHTPLITDNLTADKTIKDTTCSHELSGSSEGDNYTDTQKSSGRKDKTRLLCNICGTQRFRKQKPFKKHLAGHTEMTQKQKLRKLALIQRQKSESETARKVLSSPTDDRTLGNVVAKVESIDWSSYCGRDSSYTLNFFTPVIDKSQSKSRKGNTREHHSSTNSPASKSVLLGKSGNVDLEHDIPVDQSSDAPAETSRPVEVISGVNEEESKCSHQPNTNLPDITSRSEENSSVVGNEGSRGHQTDPDLPELTKDGIEKGGAANHGEGRYDNPSEHNLLPLHNKPGDESNHRDGTPFHSNVHQPESAAVIHADSGQFQQRNVDLSALIMDLEESRDVKPGDCQHVYQHNTNLLASQRQVQETHIHVKPNDDISVHQFNDNVLALTNDMSQETGAVTGEDKWDKNSPATLKIERVEDSAVDEQEDDGQNESLACIRDRGCETKTHLSPSSSSTTESDHSQRFDNRKQPYFHDYNLVQTNSTIIVGKEGTIASRKKCNSSWQCHICGKNMNDYKTLSQHITTHTGVKTYGCSICQKAFVVKADLKKHLRKHTGEKLFSGRLTHHGGQRKLLLAKLANATPADISPLQSKPSVHYDGIHVYQCPVPSCGQGFSHLPDMKRHSQVHWGYEHVSNPLEVGFNKANMEYSDTGNSSTDPKFSASYVKTPTEYDKCTCRTCGIGYDRKLGNDGVGTHHLQCDKCKTGFENQNGDYTHGGVRIPTHVVMTMPTNIVVATPSNFGTTSSYVLGTNPSNMFGAMPNNVFGATSENNFGTSPTNNFVAKPISNYGPSPANNFGITPTNVFGAKPANNFGITPANNFGTKPANVYGTTPYHNFGTMSVQFVNGQQHTYVRESPGIHSADVRETSVPWNIPNPTIMSGVSGSAHRDVPSIGHRDVYGSVYGNLPGRTRNVTNTGSNVIKVVSKKATRPLHGSVPKSEHNYASNKVSGISRNGIKLRRTMRNNIPNPAYNDIPKKVPKPVHKVLRNVESNIHGSVPCKVARTDSSLVSLLKGVPRIHKTLHGNVRNKFGTKVHRTTHKKKPKTRENTRPGNVPGKVSNTGSSLKCEVPKALHIEIPYTTFKNVSRTVYTEVPKTVDSNRRDSVPHKVTRTVGSVYNEVPKVVAGMDSNRRDSVPSKVTSTSSIVYNEVPKTVESNKRESVPSKVTSTSSIVYNEVPKTVESNKRESVPSKVTSTSSILYNEVTKTVKVSKTVEVPKPVESNRRDSVPHNVTSTGSRVYNEVPKIVPGMDSNRRDSVPHNVTSTGSRVYNEVPKIVPGMDSNRRDSVPHNVTSTGSSVYNEVPKIVPGMDSNRRDSVPHNVTSTGSRVYNEVPKIVPGMDSNRRDSVPHNVTSTGSRVYNEVPKIVPGMDSNRRDSVPHNVTSTGSRVYNEVPKIVPGMDSNRRDSVPHNVTSTGSSVYNEVPKIVPGMDSNRRDSVPHNVTSTGSRVYNEVPKIVPGMDSNRRDSVPHNVTSTGSRVYNEVPKIVPGMDSNRRDSVPHNVTSTGSRVYNEVTKTVENIRRDSVPSKVKVPSTCSIVYNEVPKTVDSNRRDSVPSKVTSTGSNVKNEVPKTVPLELLSNALNEVPKAYSKEPTTVDSILHGSVPNKISSTSISGHNAPSRIVHDKVPRTVDNNISSSVSDKVTNTDKNSHNEAPKAVHNKPASSESTSVPSDVQRPKLSSWRHHVSNTDRQAYHLKCKDCKKRVRFTSHHDLLRHVWKHAEAKRKSVSIGDVQRPYVCGMCDARHVTRLACIKHMRKHGGIHKCPWCYKEFINPESLTSHMERKHATDS